MTLHWVDFAAMAPLLILLLGGLVLLLLESFAEKWATKVSFPLTFLFFTLAFVAAILSPESHNSLITPWIRFDQLARFYSLFFLAIGMASTLLAHAFFRHFEATRGEYYFLLLSAVFGIVLIGVSADFLALFLGIETLSLSLYVLCAYMKKWALSKEAALKYFLMGAVAAAFLLYGIAMIYGAAGTTRFASLYSHPFAEGAETILFLGGIALITLGLAFKAAIVPFHTWAPDAYDGAPTPVTAFMAVGTKAGSFAAFAVVFLSVFPQIDLRWNYAIATLAIVTLIYANFLALRQVQLRRFFAYSGISHAGFLLMPLVAGGPAAVEAINFYLVVYALATLGCFAVMACLEKNSTGILMKDLHGLFSRSPFLAAVLTLCLLTLAGIPPTAGFFAKFYVFKLAFQAGYYALVVVGLLVAILSAFYYVRIVSLMFAYAPEDTDKVPHLWPATLIGLVSFVAIVLFSFYPDLLLKIVM